VDEKGHVPCLIKELVERMVASADERSKERKDQKRHKKSQSSAERSDTSPAETTWGDASLTEEPPTTGHQKDASPKNHAMKHGGHVSGLYRRGIPGIEDRGGNCIIATCWPFVGLAYGVGEG